MPNVRSTPNQFENKVDAQFLTGVPGNISAAKVRDILKDIAANVSSSPAAYFGTGVPLLQASVGTTFVSLEYNHISQSSQLGDLVADDTLSNRIIAQDIGNYPFNYGVSQVGYATIEGDSNVVASLAYMSDGSPAVIASSQLAGTGKPITITLPTIFTNVSLNTYVELGVATDNGAGEDLTINFAAFEVIQVPWWYP